MIIDAASERSEQGRFLSKSPGRSPCEEGAPPRQRQPLASLLTKRPDEDVRVGDKARTLKRSP